MGIDSKWFRGKVEERGYSLRKLATLMRISHSGIVRLFLGEREMHLQDAEKLATLLGVPVSEVLEHAGVDMSEIQILISALEHYASGRDGERAKSALKKFRKS